MGETDGGSLDTGGVSGVVLNAAGFAIADALVLILSVESSKTTDRNGSFRFETVPVGEQILRVEEERYQTVQKPFLVQAGLVVELEVVLPDAQQGGAGDRHHWAANELRGFEASRALLLV